TRTPTPIPTPPNVPSEVGQTTARPEAPSSVRSPDGAVVVTLPAGAVPEAATVSQTPVQPPEAAAGVNLAQTFRLEAATVAGGQPVTRFASPLWLQVAYTDADLARLGVSARELRLYYQDAQGAWVTIPAQLDEANHRLVATVDHFTVFALGTGETFETGGATASTVFADNFADMSAWTTASGGGTTAGNVLTATGAANSKDDFALTNSGAYTDLIYEVGVSDASRNANHRVGLTFHRTAANTYYQAYLAGGNTVGLRKVVGGTATTLGTAAFTYSANTVYWLKVVVTGTNVQVFTAPDVGGAPGAYTQRVPASGSITDASIASGPAGLLNDNATAATRAATFRSPRVSQILPADWSGIVAQSGHPGVVWDKTAGSAHGGTGSLQIFAGSSGYSGYAAQTTNNSVVGGTPYTASGWIKTAGLSAGASAQIVLVEQPGGTTTVVGAQTANLGWTQYTKSIVLQASTTSVDTRVLLQGAGTANFDDVVVNVSTPTPTSTPTRTPTSTPTPTPSPTPTATPTATPTFTATPTPTPTGIVYLHGATTPVGGQTYLTVNASPPSGTSTTLTNNLLLTGAKNLTDGSGRSIFVSGAVPTGQLWDVSGSWTFSAWTSATSSGGAAAIRAAVYRIDASGVPSLVTTSPDAAGNAFGSTAWTNEQWTAVVPSGTVLNPGERYGVELQMNVTTAAFAIGRLDTDTTTRDSYVIPALAVLVPTATATPTITPTVTPGGPTMTPTATSTATSTPTPAYYLHAATTVVGST